MTIHTPKYRPGQIVYALTYNNKDTNPTVKQRQIDTWDLNFAKIFKVEIVYIGISKTGIEYTLCYPDDIDNEWAVPYDEDMLNTDRQVLINKLIEKWQL